MQTNPQVTSEPDAAHHAALRDLAERAARAGAAVAERYFGTSLAVRLKSDRSEVSDADEAAQDAVVACIRAERPGDALIAEERLGEPALGAARGPAGAAASPAGDAEICWVIDPIDGTRNFLRGLPFWVCSVGVMQGGRPIAGAIYWPALRRMYAASLAEGLSCDGSPFVRAAGSPGRKPKPVVGIPSTAVEPGRAICHRWLDRFVTRSLGSTALHMAMVATGELQGVLISDSRLWDVAAGFVMLAVRGGVMLRLDGRPLFPFDWRSYRGEALPSIAASSEEMHDTLAAP